MEIWAFCKPCFQWSYVGDPQHVTSFTCPHCHAVPYAFEDRATASGHAELISASQLPRAHQLQASRRTGHRRVHHGHRGIPALGESRR